MCRELFLLPKPHVKIRWPQLLLFVYLILWIGREAQFFKMVLNFCIFHSTLFSSKTSKAFGLFWKNGLFLLIYLTKLYMYHSIFFPGGKWASRESVGLLNLYSSPGKQQKKWEFPFVLFVLFAAWPRPLPWGDSRAQPFLSASFFFFFPIFSKNLTFLLVSSLDGC